MTKRRTINFGGVPVTVVSDAEAETVDYLICMPDGPSEFTDNFKGVCSRCGCAIMYRWHAPRKPKRICIECGGKLATEEMQRKGKSDDR
jgi:rRNA maturation endonuclease Nob1